MDQVQGTTTMGQRFCSECGTGLGAATKFCAGCGFNLQTLQSAPSAGMEEPLQDAPHVEERPALRLRMAWLYFGGAVALNGLVAKIHPPSLVYAYPVAGVFLTAFVMRRLIEWHPVHNTIDNVFSAKIWMFLLWPIQMLSLLLKLTVNKVL